MKPILVADIGGTNARFAVASLRDDGSIVLSEARVYQTASFATFEACIDAYLIDLGHSAPLDAVLAVAGPAVNDVVEMTNLKWRVDGPALERNPKLGHVRVINDFVAMAWSTAEPDELELTSVKAGVREPFAPRLVLGPGTGLGVAGLMPSGDGWLAVPGEGGHIACPPYAAFPTGVFDALHRTHPGLYLELVLSGRGLVNLYRAMALTRGLPAAAETPRQVCEAAVAGDDLLCVEAARTFCLVLACVARDFALTYAARGGVFLAGGILPRLQATLFEVPFATYFETHPTYSELLQGMPVYLIRHGQAAMIGAAAWAAGNARARSVLL